MEVICEQCKQPYQVAPYRVPSTRFCSKVCAGRATIAERQRRDLEAVKASQVGFRKCKKCRQEKPLSEFEKRSDSPDGFRFQCNACKVKLSPEKKRDSDRRSHYKHRDERLAKNNERYAANREAIRAERKQWAKDNREKISEQNRLLRQKDGDKIRARRRQHYRDNKAIYVANARKREKHIKQATPPWADLKAIEQFYVRAAELTQRTGIKHHVDHIYPLKSTIMCGLHVEANLQVLPSVVNLLKSNRIEEVNGEPLCCAWPTIAPEFEMRA